MEWTEKMGRLIFLVVGFALFSFQSSADETSCEEIQTACGRAGYARDVPGGKDLMTKCYNPILQGQSVSGVKVDDETVKKCKEPKNTKSQKTRRHSQPTGS
jgi:hypothetical protein